MSKVAIGIFAFTAAVGLAIITQSQSAFAMGQVMGAVTMGLLVGCIPYYQAKKVKKIDLAQISLASCTLAGLVLGIILAIPTALIFTIYIRLGDN
jgi:uncharacterized membrane protein (Fun14 family)